VSSLDESNINNDIYNNLVVPSYLIDEAANLLQYNYTSPPPSFKDIFAQEQSLTRYNGGHAELNNTPNRLNDNSISIQVRCLLLLYYRLLNRNRVNYEIPVQI
jgi:hypothetical protein